MKFSDSKIFYFSKASSPGLGATQSFAQWVPGPIYPKVKQSGFETDLSPASRAKVMEDGSITSTTQYTFIVCMHITLPFNPEQIITRSNQHSQLENYVSSKKHR
jgi:hypothetical protein